MSNTKQSNQFFLDILIRCMRKCVLIHPQEPLKALNDYPSRIKNDEELLAWSIAIDNSLSKHANSSAISVGIVSVKECYKILKNQMSQRSEYKDVIDLIYKLSLCENLQMVVAACDVPIEIDNSTFEYDIKSICTFADISTIQNQYDICN